MLLLSQVPPCRNQEKVKLAFPFHKAYFCRPQLKQDGTGCSYSPTIILVHSKQRIIYNVPGSLCHSSWTTYAQADLPPSLWHASWIPLETSSWSLSAPVSFSSSQDASLYSCLQIGWAIDLISEWKVDWSSKIYELVQSKLQWQSYLLTRICISFSYLGKYPVNQDE